MTATPKRKILILSVSGIGNTILQSPVINKILDQENFEVDILFGSKANQSVYRNDSRIQKNYIVEKSIADKINLITQLRENRYDFSISCFPSNRFEFHLLPFLIGAQQRIIHQYKSNRVGSLSFLSNQFVPCYELLHDVDQNLNLLEPLNITHNQEIQKLHFELDPNDLDFANNYWKESNLEHHKVLGIHAGCKASESYRRWPHDNFIQTIQTLNNKGYRTLLFSGPEEKEDSLIIYGQISAEQNFLIEDLNINQVGALIQKCDQFLCSDSGLGHIATAVGTQSHVIYGPANWRRTAPYGPNGVLISLKKEHCTCFGYPYKKSNSKVQCPHNFDCLTDITPEMVLSSLLNE